jgi:hypothetical protein
LSNPELLALEAKQLLEHPAFVSAVRHVEAEYIRLWRSTDPQDWDARESYFHRIQALTDLIRDLDATIQGASIVAYNKNRLRRSKS